MSNTGFFQKNNNYISNLPNSKFNKSVKQQNKPCKPKEFDFFNLVTAATAEQKEEECPKDGFIDFESIIAERN